MNLLLTGAWQEAAESVSALEALGHRVCYLRQERDSLPCDSAWVEGVVCNGLFLYHPIETFPNLRYIQLTSAGFDRLPMDYVRAHGIELHNARGVYSAPMAEFALGSVLQIYKQLPFFRENQKAHRWEKHRGLRELSGKTVVILGCGSVGTACARRFRAFAARVLGVDLCPRTDADFDAIRPLTELDEILPTADVLVLTLPLTDATRGLIHAARLAAMKPDAVLVNLSRGAVVEETALVAHLLAVPAFTAALDVFAQEPLAEESPLWNLPNAVLTPHNSFVGENNPSRMTAVVFRNLPKAGAN